MTVHGAGRQSAIPPANVVTDGSAPFSDTDDVRPAPLPAQSLGPVAALFGPTPPCAAAAPSLVGARGLGSLETQRILEEGQFIALETLLDGCVPLRATPVPPRPARLAEVHTLKNKRPAPPAEERRRSPETGDSTDGNG